MSARHPIQQIVTDQSGIARFRKNKIVEFLLESSKYDLNDLAMMGFDDEDWTQFAQLIGYSVSGWSTLSYVSDEDVKRAARKKVTP